MTRKTSDSKSDTSITEAAASTKSATPWACCGRACRKSDNGGLTHGLSEATVNARACLSSDEPSAWLTPALLDVVGHGPGHRGNVHVGHLRAQGDLPEVGGAAAVAAPVPGVLLSGERDPGPRHLRPPPAAPGVRPERMPGRPRCPPRTFS